MTFRAVLLSGLVLMVSCGSQAPKKSDAPVVAAQPQPKPRDESARFPSKDLVDTKVIEDHLLGKVFMPGGTLAHYKHGKTEYEMFVSKLANATDAAVVLPELRTAMHDAKFIPSFGGYFGTDAGRPLFVFTKGVWLAGIAGLPEKEADAQGRILAARLN